MKKHYITKTTDEETGLMVEKNHFGIILKNYSNKTTSEVYINDGYELIQTIKTLLQFLDIDGMYEVYNQLTKLMKKCIT